MVAHTSFRTKEIAAGLDAGFLDATALAEYLVRKGVPFRKAHGIVGSLVARCEKQGKSLGQLSLEEFQECSPAIDEDVYEYLGRRECGETVRLRGRRRDRSRCGSSLPSGKEHLAGAMSPQRR